MPNENGKRETPVSDKAYEVNAYSADILTLPVFQCNALDFVKGEVIKAILEDPITHYAEAINLSQIVYNKNGIVANSVDYCTALMTLDRVITCVKTSKKAEEAKALMKATMRCIHDQQFIRDGLFSEMLTGVGFYYFDVRNNDADKKRIMNDYEVSNITEINEIGVNASILTLPWEYTKIVGKKNGRYVLAFNLEYFSSLTESDRIKKLKKYPKEISDAYNSRNSLSGNWVVLDNDHTMCCKIKSKDNEPWGRSLIIAALHDVLYRDYFIDTKRNTLDKVNDRVLYETFPENKQQTGSTLTKSQQELQHNTIKNALNNKGVGGTKFFSLAAGTKLDSIDVSTDIFDSKNEADLNNNIAMNMGISAALIGAMTTGTYSGNITNLEMITAQLYTWVSDWAKELCHVINKNVIKDRNNYVDIYYLPISFVNRKAFFEMMKTLYTDAAGSLTFLIAASGVDPDVYMSILDSEFDRGIFDKYEPHKTSYTISSKDQAKPTTDAPSDNTVRSRNQNGNATPSPSDNQ